MNLILSNKYLDSEERVKFCLSNGFSPCFVNLDGLSFEEIKESLENYKILCDEKNKEEYREIGNFETIVSSDERLLLFQDSIFDLENIYLLNAPLFYKISDCTSKELRPAHNLFKMYVAGGFSIPTF